MARTYIAFIECFFDDTKTTKQETEAGFPSANSGEIHEIKTAREDGAQPFKF